MKVLSLCLFVLICVFHSAYADILFIDLNYSEKEVETARKAAQERGEKLIVYPEISVKVRQAISGMKKEINSVESDYEHYAHKAEKETDPVKLQHIRIKQEELQARFDVVASKLQEITTANGSNYTANGMKKVLEKYNVKNGGFSSLVISGHHTSNYFGNAGNVSDGDIKELIKEFSKAFDLVRGVYLWGCYTTTKEGISFWKKNVPSAYAIAGWNGSAPKQDKKLSHDYLYKMLVSEKELSDKTTLKKAVNLFHSIPQIKISSAAMCIGNAFVDKSHSEILSEAISCPPEVEAKIKSMALEVKKYQEAEEKNYEDVPKDTSNSELRKVYSFNREVEHCRYANSFYEEELDRLAYLMFDHQIRKSFSLVYKNELNNLAEVLKRVGAPQDASIPNLENQDVTRQSILRASRALGNFEKKNYSKLSPSDKKVISEMGNRIRNILEDHGCFHPIWIENVDVETLKKNVVDGDCAVRDSRGATLHSENQERAPSANTPWYSRVLRSIGF